MKKFTPLIVVFLLYFSAISAQGTVSLTFASQTADGSYLQTDSIIIENLTRNWKETLYYPDTVYVMNIETDVPNRIDYNGIQVMPNPFDAIASVRIQSSKTEKVKIIVTDLNGRVCAEYYGMLQEGDNFFTLSLTCPQMYLLSVLTPSGTRSYKMENIGRSGTNRISHQGIADRKIPTILMKSISNHPFELGDEMRYQGYSSSKISAEVIKNQNEDDQIMLTFYEDGSPCPGVATVTDHEGNVYNTVQIGSQCWMKENLRTTTSPSTGTYLIPAPGTGYTYTGKQAFWYDNDSALYAPMNYGLLYNWNAAVDTFNTAYEETSVNQNNAVSVTFTGHRRGICPAGWHLPSDEEWTTLTSYVGLQSEYVCGGNGSYIAKALASTEYWNSCEGVECCPGDQIQYPNNATGFSAIPAGYRGGWSFGNAAYAMFWSSSQGTEVPGDGYDRRLYHNSAFVERGASAKLYGFSVRCLRD